MQIEILELVEVVDQALFQAVVQVVMMVQVLLEVRESNDAAYRLYRQEGFREIGRRKGYYPAASGREDARVMALSLDSCSLPGACPL